MLSIGKAVFCGETLCIFIFGSVEGPSSHRLRGLHLEMCNLQYVFEGKVIFLIICGVFFNSNFILSKCCTLTSRNEGTYRKGTEGWICDLGSLGLMHPASHIVKC